MELLYHTLKNGIRLVHHPVPGMVAHCGLIINTGSRDELDREHGMAHFIEHMLFKGTRTRKAFHILSRMEDVGGELNAYTTKEETAIHASFLNSHYARAIEIISDVAFNSVWPSKEIEKEKDVVIEEINSYKDNPAELIFDDFEEIVFDGQPIGRNILGTYESVRSFSRDMIIDFIEMNYVTEEMVFCSVGNIPWQKLVRLFEQYFSGISSRSPMPSGYKDWTYYPVQISKDLDTWQAHCIIGNIAFDVHNQKRTGMILLNNILGGQGLNSRLNLSLREKNGFAYNVESSYNPYSDTGIFMIYFGTENKNLAKSLTIAHREMRQLRTVRLGINQLTRAKNQIKGYLARSYENHENLMLSIGKSLQVFNRIESIEEIYDKIDKVDSSVILEIANEVFDETRLSRLIYK